MKKLSSKKCLKDATCEWQIAKEELSVPKSIRTAVKNPDEGEDTFIILVEIPYQAEEKKH